MQSSKLNSHVAIISDYELMTNELNQRNSSQNSEVNDLHSLPFLIDFIGPAQVSNFFNRENLYHENMRATSFRGHILLNKEVKVPEGYKIYTVTEDAKTNDGLEMKAFQLNGISASMNFWIKDKLLKGPSKMEDALVSIYIAEALSL